MHISEGVVSAPVLIGGGVLTAIGTAIGLKAMNYDRIMSVAMLTAAFFVASLVHIPIGPGSIHLVLIGLLGIMLGWSCFPAILVALLLQAVFFQFGGIMVLGVNTLNMAVAAILCHYLVRPWLKTKKPRRRAAAGFIAGFSAILIAALLMAFSLFFSDVGFLRAAQISVAAHFPLMVIEGFVTMFIISFLIRVHPELLEVHQS